MIQIESDRERDLDSEQDTQLPTKSEILKMFKKLEDTIKSETNKIQENLGHMLVRLEETENKVEEQVEKITKLQEQVKKSRCELRNMAYKIEDQENRNRRQNLRLRGIIEEEREDLKKKMEEIFNLILGEATESQIKIERVHRIRKPPNLPAGLPRDIILRFQYYEDRVKIWRRLREITLSELKGKKIQIFADLAPETLNRRRLLKPLLEQMKRTNVKYIWGFPACLIGYNEGRSATLRFPEDLEEFCKKLNLQTIELPGWRE